MSIVRVRDVAKTFDRIENVLDGVSFEVQSGQRLVLMGRSGSGKTTLLNVLAGLETPTRGEVLIDGSDLSKMDDETRTRFRRDKIGIVFQRFHLIPELTVQENVELPMRFADRSDAGERAHKLLDFFGISDKARAFPATLSGGETQRAAMARALGNDPAVVLADEPTASLDERNALNALDALKRVSERLGTAVIIATHDPIARDAGDRVLHLSGGRVAEEEGVKARARPQAREQGRAKGQP